LWELFGKWPLIETVFEIYFYDLASIMDFNCYKKYINAMPNSSCALNGNSKGLNFEKNIFFDIFLHQILKIGQ
jgi:hypothetical protein